MTRYIGYVRVSTEGQGKSGLGLQAQIDTIHRHLRGDDELILPIMQEIESGRRDDRPVLRAALDRCRVMNATLLLAKLDRLARNRAFVGAILASGVAVEFCDLPATKGATGTFLLGVMAEVSQLEAGLISERTKAALAASRERGTRLGGDRGHRHAPEDARRYGVAGGAKLAAKADNAARCAASLIAEIKEAETKAGKRDVSLNSIAKQLNARGAKTPRGGAWTATAVRRALARIDAAA